ncbi:pentapeptide repeat-containing protein [Streptomyces sp. NRRL S-378]|uniref:pentapeptide repeat-containing protein n=1 Tax=Streptomyces sp. NRRL S-378 TaxID=1463904 RepID=UPI001F28C0E7|nr:pentapeptide repeat-containing protein [Streptomyces sp. NRRL S-378]
MTVLAVSLPGLAALGALLFTWMQVAQASKELQISEHGQITNRFNAAVANLGSSSLDIRLGGIYALQRIMQDSVRDHPTVVSVLAAFAQQHAGSSTKSLQEPRGGAYGHEPKPDVRAAIATLARRDPDGDAGTVVDLSNTDLRGLRLPGTASIALPGVSLYQADLRSAVLNSANLLQADLRYARLALPFGGDPQRLADALKALLGPAGVVVELRTERSTRDRPQRNSGWTSGGSASVGSGGG